MFVDYINWWFSILSEKPW